MAIQPNIGPSSGLRVEGVAPVEPRRRPEFEEALLEPGYRLSPHEIREHQRFYNQVLDDIDVLRGLPGPAPWAQLFPDVGDDLSPSRSQGAMSQKASIPKPPPSVPPQSGKPARLPNQVPQMKIKLEGRIEVVDVNCSLRGNWKDSSQPREAWECYQIVFSTYVLGLDSKVYCSLVFNLDPKVESPVGALEKVVQAHLKAMSQGGHEGVKKLPESYTVRAGERGEAVVGDRSPHGHYEALPGGQPFETYNKMRELAPGQTRVRSEADIEVQLSSGKSIRTTQIRLQKARALAEKVTFMVQADGSRSRANPEQIEKAAQRLAAFNVEDLATLEKAGYQVLLVDRARAPKGGYPGGRPGLEVNKDGSWNPNCLAYCSYKDKVITVPVDSVDKVGGGGSDTLLHELSHALSDAKVADTSRHEVFGYGFGGTVSLSLDSSPTVTGGWAAYRKRCGWTGRDKPLANPSGVWSDYALTGPQEYFAEGVTFYKQGGNARALLEEKDPSFFQYLRGLFRDDPG